MISGLRSELEAALQAMEGSFHVRLIGTFGSDLECAPADADAAEWLESSNPDFDQFPVRDGSETIGVLDRQGARGRVREIMQPLREGLIVSADMPITDLLPGLRENHYRLVLRGQRIDGLVTQSDLLKLPVRLVAFGLITHLEQVMAEVIATRWPGDDWLELLSAGRQGKVAKKLASLSSRRMNPPLLELTEFCDKRDLCRRLLGSDRVRFGSELDKLKELRDQLAHAGTYLDDGGGQASVIQFVDQIDSAKDWTTYLTELATNLRGEQ